MIKLRYKKSRIRNGLIFSGILVIGFTVMALLNPRSFINYVGLAFALLYAAMFLYDYKKQYLTIKGNILVKNSLPPKKIDLSEVETVRKFAGDYTLKSARKRLVIHTDWMGPGSLNILNELLEKHNILEE